MESPKLEDIEKNNLSKVQTEKAEIKIRKLERDDKELTIKTVEPNATYEKNGYIYQTDSHACPVRVTGELKLGEASRTKQQGEIGKLGNIGDEGGHIIGAQFDGPTDAFNIRPQDAHLNHSDFAKLEHQWARALDNGQKVKVDISLHYSDNTIRPDRYIVKYWIDGKEFKAILKNLPEQS